MSMPGEHDFVDQRAAWVGSTWTKELTWRNAASLVGIPLTGYAISFVILNDDGTTAQTLTIGSGVTVTDSAGGKFTLTLTAAQTAALGLGLRRYTLTLTSASATVSLLVGRIAFVDSQ